MIKTESKFFLDGLAKWPRNNFEQRFSAFSLSLQLCDHLTKGELNMLYDATLLAAVCSMALNDVWCKLLCRSELFQNGSY